MAERTARDGDPSCFSSVMARNDRFANGMVTATHHSICSIGNVLSNGLSVERFIVFVGCNKIF